MPRSHAVVAVFLAGVMAASLHAQADWPGYGRDKGAQRYSPLAQINTGNVAKLVQQREHSWLAFRLPPSEKR